MKKNKMQFNCKKLINAAALALITTLANAQLPNIIPAGAGLPIPPNIQLEFCEYGPSLTCPSAMFAHTTTTPTALNADMVTLNTANFLSTPSSLNTAPLNQTSNFGQLYGVTFSGITNSDNGMAGFNGSGFTIRTTFTSGAYASVPIPYWLNNGSNAIANDPDIAIGSNPNGQFALVVYEENGTIYLEHYQIHVALGSITTIPENPRSYLANCPTLTCPPSVNNRITLSTSNQCSKPHISLWHNKVTPGIGVTVNGNRYAVTWQQVDGVNGGYDVYGTDGVISNVGTNFFPAANNDFKIADGKHPDIAATTIMNLSDPDKAYTCYLDNNGKNVYGIDWEYNTHTLGSAIALNSSSTLNNDEFQFPRIAGAIYLNNEFSPSLMHYAVVVNDNDGNAPIVIDKVSGYRVFYDASLGSFVSEEYANLSDMDGNGFSFHGHTAIMPTITGTGVHVASWGCCSPPPASNNQSYVTYPIGFYSDFTYPSPTNDGDYFYTAFDFSPGTYPSGAFSMGSFWEISHVPLNNGSAPFDMTNKPAIAVATSNNLGYDLLTAFYAGGNENEVWMKFTGTNMPYYFKPGRPSSVTNVDQNGYIIYPNPVDDALNISDADGATFTITDMLGRQLASGKLSGNTTSIATANLLTGSYILQISKDGYSEHVKFAKR